MESRYQHMTTDEQVTHLTRDIGELRASLYDRDRRERERREADQRLWVVGAYCFVIGWIFGRRDARKETAEAESTD